MNAFPVHAALVLLSIPLPLFAAAQAPAPSVPIPQVRGGTGATPVSGVLRLTYDVQLERLRDERTPLPGRLGLGATPCYDNSEIIVEEDPQYVVANPGEEVLNVGRKTCQGASLLRRFTIAYRSEAIDVSQGGPGAALSLALYKNTRGWGMPGTEVFRRTFTGLPAKGAPAGPNVVYDHNGIPLIHPEPMVFLTIDFGTEPLALPDGRIGWGFMQLDGDTGPVLVRAPKFALGTFDAMDIYSPGPATAATYAGTFNYGGCEGIEYAACANSWIQLDEIATSELASSTVLNGTGVNPPLLDELFPARLGHVWGARIAVSPSSAAPSTTLFSSRAAASAPIASPFGEILIAPTRRLAAPMLAEGSYAIRS